MAVQSWSDVLKSSKKTALLNDGEFFIDQIKFFLGITDFNVGEYFSIISE